MAYGFPEGSKFYFSQTFAATKTVSAVTNANPAVATSTAHGYSNGDYVVLSVTGMFELDNVVARVAGVATDSFQLEGIDSTLYTTFSAGTAKKITFGASMTTAVGVNASGGESEFADTTTIHDLVKKRAPTVVSAVSMTLDSIWDPSNAALQQLNAASKTKTKRAVQIRFADGTRMLGSVYVAAPLVPTGSAGEVVKTPVSLEFQGLPQVYTS